MAWFVLLIESFESVLTYLTVLFPGQNGDEWISLAFALMKKKDASSYELVFSCIKEQWRFLGVEPVFRMIFMDFEDAELKAAIACFGLDVIMSSRI